MSVDLHCHSNISDGVLPPNRLAERAALNGVRLWALTDHDELSGLIQARQSAESLGIQFIDGVEISVNWEQQTLHIVGLGIDANNKTLHQAMAKIRSDRGVRAQEMADKLDQLGIPGAFEGALAFADNPSLISRTHFARFLLEKGYCTYLQEAFDRYLGDGRAAYVMGKWASLEEAVDWIKHAGGIAVIAHPGRYKYSRSQFSTLFKTFKLLGGKAIEVVTGSHSKDQYYQYAQVAKQYGFLASCGSDYHGTRENGMDVGKVPALPDGLTPVWKEWGYE